MNNDVDNDDQYYLDENTWSDTYKDLTHERVKELFDYDAEQGLLIWKERPVEDFKIKRAWKTWNTQFLGKAFGGIDTLNKNRATPSKRRRGCVNRKKVLHYRLVWLFHNKKIPKIIDHIDQNSLNDKIENLRPSNALHNQRNTKMDHRNTSGVTGVCWDKCNNKWLANITVKGKQIYLGRFTNKEDAIQARKEAEIKYNFDPNHGKLKEESTS